MTFLIDGMIFAGSGLMVYNIFSYTRFAKRIREKGNWEKESTLFTLPIILLVAFLGGYLAVGLFGHPDLVIGGILFGGSIFVLVMLWFIQHITGRIQEKEHLEAALASAQEANRAKTFFLSNMSHDLRTPLNAIIGYTALARKENLTAEEIRSYLSKIALSGQQLLEIVNDVLEMSRIESGKLALEEEDIDLAYVVEQAYDTIAMQMEEKEIHFEVNCDVQERWVRCDKRYLNRALMNLLSNANKFTPEGGEVSLTVLQTGREGSRGVYEFHVRDNGIGMSPEFVKKLFIPFEREQTSTISKIQGTGLGMSITNNIVDRMGGTIEVETGQGKGTEFIIRLSLEIAADQHEEEIDGKMQERGGQPEERCFCGKRLLLAEDNMINQEIAAMILKEAGFCLEIAENGQEALEMVQKNENGHYDAILMDIQMPVMDGYEAARRIRSLEDPDKAGIPIIAVTANAFREDREEALRAGMQGHIAKPYDQSIMLETIAQVLKTYAG